MQISIVIKIGMCQKLIEHCIPTDEDLSGLSDEPLLIIAGSTLKLRSCEMSNSDSDAST